MAIQTREHAEQDRAHPADVTHARSRDLSDAQVCSREVPHPNLLGQHGNHQARHLKANGVGSRRAEVSRKIQATNLCILIADDHTLFRHGLRMLLQSEPGFQVIGEASDGHEAVELTRRLEPDIVLLDVVMPGGDGIDALRELATFESAPKILLLTASLGKADMIKALKLGASGVLLKDASTARLFESIRCVMAGQYWIGRESVSDLVKALRAIAPLDGADRPKHFGLTPRESQVVSMVAEGYSNPDIAQRCRISEQTVKHHIGHIFDKLGVSNRLELALFAVNHGLILWGSEK